MAKDNGYSIDDIKGAARDAGPFDDAVDRLAAQRGEDIVSAVRRYAIETHEQYALNLLALCATLAESGADGRATRQRFEQYADALQGQAKAWREGKVP